LLARLTINNRNKVDGDEDDGGDGKVMITMIIVMVVAVGR